MTTSMTVAAAILAVFFGYTILAPVAANLGRFIGRSWLYCPKHRVFGAVKLNALSAALTAGYGEPMLAVRNCSLREPGQTCDERCLNGADL